jgi:hypothetical protein
MFVAHELVYGEQFDRRHPEVGQVAGDGRVREAGVRAPDFLGHFGVPHREALHVGFIDHRFVEREAGGCVARPVEVPARNNALGHGGCRVERVLLLGLLELVAEDLLAPGDVAVDGCGMGVEEELGGVTAEPFSWCPRPVDAEPVPVAGPHARDQPVPNMRLTLGQLDPVLLARRVEYADLDRLCHFRVEGEVGTQWRRRSAQGER